jgi:hypothetical protein
MKSQKDQIKTSRRSNLTKHFITILQIITVILIASPHLFAQSEPSIKGPDEHLIRQVNIYKKFHSYQLKFDKNGTPYIQLTFLTYLADVSALKITYKFSLADTVKLGEQNLPVDVKRNAITTIKVYFTDKDLGKTTPDISNMKVTDFYSSQTTFKDGGRLMEYLQFYPVK